MPIAKFILNMYRIRITTAILTIRNKIFYSNRQQDKKFKTLEFWPQNHAHARIWCVFHISRVQRHFSVRGLEKM